MLQWCNQKIGSRGDMKLLISPLMRTCTWSWGPLSNGPFKPFRRCQVDAVLFCPVGRVLPNTSKLVSASKVEIRDEPATLLGMATVWELRVGLNSGLGAPPTELLANAAGNCGLAVQSQ